MSTKRMGLVFAMALLVGFAVGMACGEDDGWVRLFDGDRITVKVDGEVVNEYVERPEDIKGDRKLSQGTIALQAHDPDSLVHYKDIYIRVGTGD